MTGHAQPKTSTRRQIRGSALLLGGQVVATVINLATQVLIVRYLAKAEFGGFAYALAVASVAEVVTGLGLRRAVSRQIPVYEERGEFEKAAGTLVFVLVTVLLLGTAIVVIIVGLRGLIAGSLPPPAPTLVGILVILAPLQALATLLDGVYAVYTRPLAIVLRRLVLAPLLRLSVVGLVVTSGSGVELLAAGYVTVALLALSVYAVMLPRTLREQELWSYLRGREWTFPIREVLAFTAPLLTIEFATAVVNTAGPLLLGLLATATDVAELRAVLPVALTMSYLLSAFMHLFTPLAARLYARGERDELNRLYWQTAAWSSVVTYPLFLVASGMAEPLTTLLFGERYEDAAVVLAILAVGLYATAATGPNDVLLTVFGRIRYVVVTNLLTICLSLGLNFLLIPAYGAVGSAIAISATFVLLNVIRQVGLRTRTTVSALDRAHRPLYVRILIVTAAYYALLVIASPPPLAAAAATAVASGAVLLLGRRTLAMSATFPELARLPGVRLLAKWLG